MKHFVKFLLTITVLGGSFTEEGFSEEVLCKLPKHKPKHMHKAKHHHKHAPLPRVSSGMTLAQAMKMAQETHPEISAFDAARQAASHRITQVKALRLPILEVKAGAGKEYLRQKFSSNKLNPSPLEGSVNETRYDPSVSLRQPLFDGFDSSSQIEKATLETQQAELKKAESMELIAFKASDHYIAVRRFKRLLELAEENVRQIRGILGNIEEQIRAGRSTIVDREIATARLEDALAAIRDIEGDYHTAIANFIDIVGVDPHDLQNAEIAKNLMPATAEEGLKLAAQNNRSLILARATKDVAKADIEVSKSPFYPKLSLEVDAAKRHHVGGKPGAEDNVTALVVARFNIFNGGRDVARTKELRARALQAHYTMVREKRNAEREVRISISERDSAYRQVEVLREAVKAKKNVAESYKAQFIAGKRSFLDILDAVHEYFLAKGSKITAESTYDLSCTRYLASVGQLTKLLLNKELPKYQLNADTDQDTLGDRNGDA